MTIQVIPIQAVPNQTLQVPLGSQSTILNIYQFQYGLFCDVIVNSSQIRGGIICQNLNRIVREAYLGFSGDLVFSDTQGSNDPVYYGLGSRWILLYDTAGFVEYLTPVVPSSPTVYSKSGDDFGSSFGTSF